MGELFKLPSLEERMAAEMEPTLAKIITMGLEDARRHVQRYYPELYREYGEELTQVWASLLFAVIKDVGYEKTLEALGSREKYEFLAKRLFEKP
jgi:hypothetical protein